MRASALFVSVACTAALLASFASRVAAAVPDIVTRDVDRFYAIYDAAGGTPTAEQLQRD